MYMQKMGVGMDLEFDKYCKVDQSPRTVLKSSHHTAKHESKSRNSNSGSRNSRLSSEAGFKEIKLRNYHRSISCKTLPTRNNELAVDREVLKRGSVYQRSNERNSFKKTDGIGGRKKIELSLSGGSPFSFSLLDSICGSDEEEEEPSRGPRHVTFDDRENSSYKPAERDSIENSKFKSHEVVGPSNSANILKEDENKALLKSLSAKLSLPHSPTRSGSDGSSKASSVSRFTPIRKMLYPLTKSKSHRSPLSPKLEDGVTSSGKNKPLQKSLLRDFSTTVPCTQCTESSAPTCSSAQLHGDLKLEHKHGVPYFELSLAHTENVLVAKTWKTEDALSWVYTFHSVPSRKRSNASGYGAKYSTKDSPMIGQMQVSCHLCSELKEGGAISSSMMMEFVLYDIMHARKSFAAVEPGPESDVVEARASNKGSNAFEYVNVDLLIPLAASDLHPCHEIAAVVVQVPFKKRESLQHRSGDTPKGISDISTSTRVCVVTPLGNHSMPACESRGPSALLDRWRVGGGCDCGGWDMGCALNVFDNISTRCKEENHSLLRRDQPFDLYVQGVKEKSAALTMKSTGKGQYSVDFHAQLSALQALGICVAVLHAAEASPVVDQEKNKQLLQCRSMKVRVEDEVKLLIEAVTEEKEKIIKASEDHPASFVLNPPFSPIARV